MALIYKNHGEAFEYARKYLLRKYDSISFSETYGISFFNKLIKEKEMEFPYKIGDKVKIVKNTGATWRWSSTLSNNYPWGMIDINGYTYVNIGDTVTIKDFKEDSVSGFNFIGFKGEVNGKDYGFIWYYETKDWYELVKPNKRAMCINNGNSLKLSLNKIYDVINEDRHFFDIINDDGRKESYFKWRFKIIEEGENKMEYELIKSFTAEQLRKDGACDQGIEEFIKHFGFIKTVPFNEESLKIMQSIHDCVSFLLRKGYIKKVEGKKYWRGQKFSYGTEKYILAQVELTKCALVSLEDGNRWVEPKTIKNPLKISQDEFNELCGGNDFKPIEG